jgi:hypothetical protein
MGQLDLNQHSHSSARWLGSVTLAGAALALFALPASAQAGHASAGGHISATRPMAPSRSVTPSRSVAPSRATGSVGTPIHTGFSGGRVRPNSFGASSAPPPSWELPRTVTPHWEIGPNIPVQPNQVQGNHVHRNRGAFGVGFVGLPYYSDPFAFGNAWDWNNDGDTAQQTQPGAPPPADYGPQAPYGGPQAPYGDGAYDQGYGPSPRPPYNPGAYPPQQQNSAAQYPAAQNTAAPDDGLDHPPVTLVFNDGRPPEQVNSYVLTGSSVFVAEHGHQRVIPVADLDLPATIAQNREAGVEFTLPGGSR